LRSNYHLADVSRSMRLAKHGDVPPQQPAAEAQPIYQRLLAGRPVFDGTWKTPKPRRARDGDRPAGSRVRAELARRDLRRDRRDAARTRGGAALESDWSSSSAPGRNRPKCSSPSRAGWPLEVTKVGSLGTGTNLVSSNDRRERGCAGITGLPCATRRYQLWHRQQVQRCRHWPRLVGACHPRASGETEYVSTRLLGAARPKLRERLRIPLPARLRPFARQDRARPREPEERRGVATTMWRMA